MALFDLELWNRLPLEGTEPFEDDAHRRLSPVADRSRQGAPTERGVVGEAFQTQKVFSHSRLAPPNRGRQLGSVPHLRNPEEIWLPTPVGKKGPTLGIDERDPPDRIVDIPVPHIARVALQSKDISAGPFQRVKGSDIRDRNGEP